MVDNFMTASAKFADILLPGTLNVEEKDIAPQHHTGKMGYIIFGSQAIKPLFESKNIYDICAGIAKYLGVEEGYHEGRNRDQWVEYVYNECRKKSPQDYPADINEAFEKGIVKRKITDEPWIPFEDFRKDPVKNPVPTPSGKLEIFSKALWDISNEWILPKGQVITALPEYTPPNEGLEDPLRKKYPLQMITTHPKQRVHSCYGNVDWLKEIAPQQLWINTIDARERGIAHGDRIRVFNDRGVVEVMAKVTPRMMPGVLSLPEGAWFTPDANGVDQEGAAHTLTKYEPSPLAKANPSHTNLVQVKKV